MTSCNFCGVVEMQEYTFDDIFTCNSCIDKSINYMSPKDKRNIIFIDANNKKKLINQSEDLDIIIEDDTISCLKDQINFLRKQLLEKDLLIRRLLSINEFITVDDTPIIPKEISTPVPSSSFQNSFLTDASEINDEYDAESNETLYLCEEINNKELDTIVENINKTFNLNKEVLVETEKKNPIFYKKEKIKENINHQLKDIRIIQGIKYNNFKKNKLNNTELSSHVNPKNMKDKIIKDTMERLSKKRSGNLTLRYRIQNKIHQWPIKTTLIAGDSIIQGLDESRLKKYKCKVRSFPGAVIDDMYDYLEPLLKKKPTNIILHIGTNDATTKFAGKIINELKNLAIHIKEVLPDTNIFMSSPTIRIDNIKANKILQEVNDYMKTMENSIMNVNIVHVLVKKVSI